MIALNYTLDNIGYCFEEFNDILRGQKLFSNSSHRNTFPNAYLAVTKTIGSRV